MRVVYSRAFFVILLAVVFVGQDRPRAQPPQSPAREAWQGVYTQAQAERGRLAAQQHCAQCHGDELRGAPRGPSLVGDVFMLHWEGRGLDQLWQKILKMPPRAQNVSEDDRLAAAAYMLEKNNFPAGDAELVADVAQMSTVKIVRKEGIGPPRTGALVQVIGCLVRDKTGGFQLQSATEPALTTLENSPEAGRGVAAPIAAGTLTFGLLRMYPDPAAHEGHRMLAKALMIRNPAGDRLNVMSFEMIAAGCSP